MRFPRCHGRGNEYKGRCQRTACHRTRRGLNELKFTRISFHDTTVEAETDKPARLEVITGVGKVKEMTGTSVKWTMEGQYSASGPRNAAHVFARIKAYALDGSGEELFSQPYMLVPSSNGLVR